MQVPQPYYPPPAPVYQPQPPRPKTDGLSIAQLIFSLLTFFGSLSIIAVMLFTVWMPGAAVAGAAPANSMLLIALAAAVVAVVALLSAAQAIRRLRGQRGPASKGKRMTWLNRIILPWPLVLILGATVANRDPQSGLLPWLLTLGLVIPTVWLLRYGANDLWGALPQRHSGLFTFSAGFSLYFVIFLELIAILLLVLVLVMVAPMLPGMQEILQELSRAFMAGPQALEDPRLMERLTEMIKQPGIIGLLILGIGVIAPFIEELFKPLGVWLLVGRKPAITPAQGYLAGLFSGAAFALVEGLLYGVQVTNQGTDGSLFVSFVLGRTVGLLLHIFLSGLNGWAIAKAWQDKRWGRPLGMLLLTTFIHGAWNSLGILNGINGSDPNAVFATNHLLTFVPLMLIFMGIFVGFFTFTARVHRDDAAAQTHPAL